MALWIPITILAAFAQNLRFMLQKYLRGATLGATGATFARYLYSAPFVVALVGLYMGLSGAPLPRVSVPFLGFATLGAVAQILATVCVVALFGARNFAVGIAFKKTEVVQAAILGYLLLGEGISALGAVAILVGLVGVILLAAPPEKDGALGARGGWNPGRLINRASVLGLGAGLLFAFAAVGYRGALIRLEGGDVFLRAAFTLGCVTTFQTAVMALWLWWRDPGEIGRVLRAWRVTGLVGLASMVGSLGWFAAFALQTVAYVKALGQIELVFSFLATHFVFHEKTTPREGLAMALIVGSILLLVAAL